MGGAPRRDLLHFPFCPSPSARAEQLKLYMGFGLGSLLDHGTSLTPHHLSHYCWGEEKGEKLKGECCRWAEKQKWKFSEREKAEIFKQGASTCSFLLVLSRALLLPASLYLILELIAIVESIADVISLPRPSPPHCLCL